MSIPSFQKFSFYCPTAQMAEFMVPNGTYRATVYTTGHISIPIILIPSAFRLLPYDTYRQYFGLPISNESCCFSLGKCMYWQQIYIGKVTG